MIRLSSAAKLNLGLRITGLRSDGCHELQSIFYPLPSPKDDIFIKCLANASCSIAPVAGIEPQNNIIRTAWQMYAETTGFAPGVAVSLHKHVPMGAGLGGGSANAASFLKWLNAQAPTPLRLPELIKIAAKIGADVPFFLYNCPCHVAGKGEIVQPIQLHCQGLYLVLICPALRVSTAWAFREWDRKICNREKDTSKKKEKINGWEKCLTKTESDSRNPNSVEIEQAGLQDIHNDLEAVVFSEYPELAALKREILNLGALGAAMSGSGSSIYGIFPNGTAANLAAATLRVKWPRVYCLPMGSYAGV